MSTDDGDDYTGTIRAWRAAPDLMPDDPEPWRAQAACRGVDPDVFFPEKGQSVGGPREFYTRARVFCARCPVREACLDYALERSSWPEDAGMWGGTTPRERRQIRAARGAS